MATQTITETRKPEGMSDAQWANELRTKTAAQLQVAGYVTTRTVTVPDPDPDLVTVQNLRAASLGRTLTATELSNYQQARIRLEAKGLL